MPSTTRSISLIAAPRALRLPQTLASIWLLAAATTGQSVELENPGFEVGADGATPEGWHIHPPDPEPEARISTAEATAGERSAVLESNPGAEPRAECYLLQWLPGEDLSGRRVVLRAAQRFEGSKLAGYATLWATTTSSDGPQAVHHTYARRVRDPEWFRRQLVFDVPEGTKEVGIGLRLTGRGQALIDDVSLTIVGVAGDHEAPRELERHELENLVAFSRLLGYVRHFHPSDQASDVDWAAIAVDGVRRVSGAEGPEALAAALEEVFVPLGPTLQVFPTGTAPVPYPALQWPEGERSPYLHTWKQNGFGPADGIIYQDRRIKRRARQSGLPEGFIDPADVVERELPGGVTCRVPLTLWGDRKRTYPVESLPWTPPTVLPSAEDRATRLAAVALAWNVFQHYYPYFDVVGERWEGSLERTLARAATDSDAPTFLRTLDQLVASVEDAHGQVQHAESPYQACLPLRWEWIEDKVIVTGRADWMVGAHPGPGDELIAIDGVPVSEVIACEMPFCSAPNERVRRDRVVRRLLVGPLQQEVELEFEFPDGKHLGLSLEYEGERLPRSRPPQVHELESGILYVDLDRVGPETIAENIERMKEARGLVFDLRGYPQDMQGVLSYLTEEALPCPQWWIPAVTRPDREGLEWEQSPSWFIQPAGEVFRGRVAFITNSIAQSAAETYLSFVEAFELGDLVGEATAGTNGNAVQFDVPGGYRIQFTGMRVLKRDGSQHHAIGILPTVPVSRTRPGVLEGRDELLEKAVEVVKDLGGSIERGDFHMFFEEYEQAVEAYGQGLLESPEDVELLERRATACLFAHDVEALLADAQTLVRLAPESSTGYTYRAWALSARGEHEAAIAELEYALKTFPEEPRPIEELARQNYMLEEWQKAWDLAERALQGEPVEEWDMLLLRWHARRRLGDQGADAELSASFDHEDGGFYTMLARMLLGEMTGREFLQEVEAIEDLSAIGYSLAYFHLGSLRLLEGDPDAAARFFEKCAELKVAPCHEYWMAKKELEGLDF